MDTALITFHLQTSPSTQSVHLIGSWDNFSKHYPMERDIRRSRGHWRGCHSFEDIICDGNSGGSSKRNGGLKMGSTYYYYYELNDGTEHYDSTIPSTTSCPYLPGQPVNYLWVPVEIQPLRLRSASLSSVTSTTAMTMKPADKFLTPRAPPPTPGFLRPNTSTHVLAKQRSARSLSPPKSERSQWSPRAFFGLKSPSNPPHPVPAADKRGRSTSAGKMTTGSNNSSTTSLVQTAQVVEVRRIQRPRDASPRSVSPAHLRALSEFQFPSQEPITYTTTTLEIPDEIEEEAEDDENFASLMNRDSFNAKGIFTPLAPPPSAARSPLARSNTLKNDTSKPLPQLPEAVSTLSANLRLRSATCPDLEPRSHFSMSTISTAMSSPTHSEFNFSETTSQSDFNDDVDADVDADLTTDLGSGDEQSYDSPMLKATQSTGFSGYSLPESEFSSEQTLRKQTPVRDRTTSGPHSPYAPPMSPVDAQMTALEQLLSEMGYLGNVIAK